VYRVAAGAFLKKGRTDEFELRGVGLGASAVMANPDLPIAAQTHGENGRKPLADEA
jgi:hypothetical protein